ncbi:mechanosensitive ion channel family protein [Fimbriimonas ginsengisoli]|uniref:TM helix repeat-containing protein n=1 Tax=Fimbriimonas ginsengisoli Gsoil 348 TaxID=661478 RepID=A0A068NM89_FIMGI|nr:hypothetical protein [Fimbriimonas ginsengisoli]AIE84551.1 TM helix repeat-containing protein [Fimbriimonas ginsengisoli Gsoil 348]
MDGTSNVTVNNGWSGLEAAWFNTLSFLPKLLAFALILVVGYFIATALGKVVDKLLTRVGFDRAVERSGIRAALASSGFHPSQILGKLAFYTIFLFVLQLAFGVFGQNPISDLLTRVIAFIPNIFVAIVITVIAASIAAAVRDIVNGALGGLSYGKMLANLAAGAIVVVGVFAALNQLQIAPAIVNGLFYAILAIVVGVSIVAIGGAGIQPMRARWESALNRLDQEVPRIQQEASAAQPTAVVTPTDRTGYVS